MENNILKFKKLFETTFFIGFDINENSSYNQCLVLNNNSTSIKKKKNSI